MFHFAPNLDLLFIQAGAHAGRIRAASAAGFTSVEMGTHSGKDMNALRDAMDETAARRQSQLAEPRAQLMIDDDHEAFFARLDRCLHSLAEGESVPDVLAGFADAIRCVQIADFSGPIGLENHPTSSSAESMRAIKQLVPR